MKMPDPVRTRKSGSGNASLPSQQIVSRANRIRIKAGRPLPTSSNRRILLDLTSSPQQVHIQGSILENHKHGGRGLRRLFSPDIPKVSHRWPSSGRSLDSHPACALGFYRTACTSDTKDWSREGRLPLACFRLIPAVRRVSLANL
jgi:hypothetical protein